MYKVIADSSSEVDQIFLENYPVEIVPFRLFVDGVEYVDDENLNVDEFVNNMVNSSVLPKSACPSPNDFIEKFKGEENEIYVVTIAAKLSGTHNSAVLAKSIYESEHSDGKLIHVFDSLGASAAETLVTYKIHECKHLGHGFDETVRVVELFIKEMKVYFISESLDNLIKNGRISKWKGMIASTLKIMPIMGADETGEIILIEKVRGSNKAYARLIEILIEEATTNGKKAFAVTHVGNPERANQVESALKTVSTIDSVFNIKCAGLSSLYADNKGIIVAL